MCPVGVMDGVSTCISCTYVLVCQVRYDGGCNYITYIVQCGRIDMIENVTLSYVGFSMRSV